MNDDQLKTLAKYLHNRYCPGYCKWHDEIKEGKHLWSGHTHKRWLEKAKASMAKIKEIEQS